MSAAWEKDAGDEAAQQKRFLTAMQHYGACSVFAHTPVGWVDHWIVVFVMLSPTHLLFDLWVVVQSLVLLDRKSQGLRLAQIVYIPRILAQKRINILRIHTVWANPNKAAHTSHLSISRCQQACNA